MELSVQNFKKWKKIKPQNEHETHTNKSYVVDELQCFF